VRSEKGFTLVEVLVALVILAVGLLGMATLLTSSMQSSQGAYRRSQASTLAYDLVERMRFNRDRAVSSDDYTLAANAGASTSPSCASGGCTPAQLAQKDLFEWRAALGNALPGATAAVTRSNDNKYQVTINWDEIGAAVKNSSGDTLTPSFTLRVDL
jgi:type IV pilus assembly protein PilV